MSDAADVTGTISPKLAFLFPGQGSQKVGMGKALYDASQLARAVFDEADATLGFALSKLCFEGPEEQLTLTANAQPAILTTSIAALRVLQAETGLQPAVVAGHSLGEYSALVAAGALALADAVKVVNLRGRFMQDAVPSGVGAMAAILGLDAGQVEAWAAWDRWTDLSHQDAGEILDHLAGLPSTVRDPDEDAKRFDLLIPNCFGI